MLATKCDANLWSKQNLGNFDSFTVCFAFDSLPSLGGCQPTPCYGIYPIANVVQVVPRVFGTSMLERFWAEWPLSEADNGELPLVSVCGQWVLGSTYGRTVFLPSLTSADFSQRFCSKNSLIVLILEISDSIPSMLAVIATIAITSAAAGDVKGCWCIILSFM